MSRSKVDIRTEEGYAQNVSLSVIFNALEILFDFLKVICCIIPVLCVTIYRTLVPRKPKDITGKTVLITGGGNGLGKAMAHEFANRGSNVVIVDIDREAAEQTCAELRQQQQVSAYVFQVDVSSYAQVEAMAASVHRTVGCVDILVNNAGVINFGFLQNTDIEVVNQILDVNVKATVWITRLFLDKMLERRQGHIVCISSLAGMHPFPWGTVYSTSKHAINGFMGSLTEQLRLQGYGDQIQTTCVNPYYIATRKDIVDFLRKPRFEVLSTQSTAQTIVGEILRNQTFVTVPASFGLGIRFMQLFPLKIQQLVRDHIMKEYELNST